jgi:isoleucyl-tRNA synthetase
MTGNQDQGATRGIKSLPAQIDLPAMESQILQYWQENNIFQKTLYEPNEEENSKCKLLSLNFNFLLFII